MTDKNVVRPLDTAGWIDRISTNISEKETAPLTDGAAMEMRHDKCTPINEVTSEILDILEAYGVTIGSLDKVLASVKEMANFNTPVKNIKVPMHVHR